MLTANAVMSSTVGSLKQTDCISAWFCEWHINYTLGLLPSMRKCFGYRNMGTHLLLLELRHFQEVFERRRGTVVNRDASRSPALMSDYSHSQEVHNKGQPSSTTQV